LLLLDTAFIPSIQNGLFGGFIQPEMRMKSQHYVGTCVKIFDMTGLGFSAFARIKVLTAIATVDDLNYPEKTDVYYIVNAPYVFSACWKVCSHLIIATSITVLFLLSVFLDCIYVCSEMEPLDASGSPPQIPFFFINSLNPYVTFQVYDVFAGSQTNVTR
jgi:hypothetical protein